MSRSRQRALAAIVLTAMAACAGCAGASDADQKELTNIARMYLTDQVNSVTENKQSNRFFGTSELPQSELGPPLSDELKQELPRIKAVRDGLRGTESELDWGKPNLVNPDISVSGDTATMTLTEQSELHYRFLGRSTYYSVDHKMKFDKPNGSWRLIEDDLDTPKGVDEPAPYARKF